MADVCVLTGGRSLERTVSLRSAARVERALRELGHAPDVIDIGPDLVGRLRDRGYDAAFICTHGRGGEDGTLQELCELLGLPYTGSGVSASARCFDKLLLKHELDAAGLPTPEFVSFSQETVNELGAAEALPAAIDRLGMPLIVKPARMGSALGIGVAHNESELDRALLYAFSYDHKVVVERFLPDARDLAVGVLDGSPLPIVEATPSGRKLYDFDARYTPGLTRFTVPADLSDDLAAAAWELALQAAALLGVRGAARVDLLLAGDDLWVIDLPTVPGLTETSLLPMAAEAARISFTGLVASMLDSALID